MTLAYERIGAGRVRTAQETADSRKRVRGFWHHCDYARDTIVARYLGRRGLSWLAGNPNVRFHAECPHPSGVKLPAMVCLVRDGNGDVCAVHRTFLNPDGTKANVEPNKASIGSFVGGAIRIIPVESEMVVAEGLETAASAGAMLGLPAWSAIACGNLGYSLVLPSAVRSVVIAADHDRPGRRAAARAAQRWRAEGCTVQIIQPDLPGQDFNDIMRDRLQVQHA